MPDWNELLKSKEHRWKEPDGLVLDLCAKLDKGSRVLDLGCGSGRHLVCLARQGHEVYGTDVSPKAIELSSRWLEEEKLGANLFVLPMTDLPFENNFFDAVISTNVINHAHMKDIKTCISEIGKALKKGGLFYAIVISDKDFRCGIGKEVDPVSSPRTYVPDIGPEKGVIHHYFNEEDFRLLLKDFDYSLKFVTRDVDSDSADQKNSVIKGYEEIIRRKKDCIRAHWEIRAQKVK